MADVAQIQKYAANAGFSGRDLDTAVAIALAESNPPGNEHSYNPEPQKGTPEGQGSYGLWQIYLWKHPEFAGMNLYDPQTNAHAAYDIYSRAGGFSPWTTYKTGKYQAYLQPAATVPEPLVLDAATGLPINVSAPVSTGDDSAAMQASILQEPPLSFGKVLLWGAVGLFALWIFEEAL